MSTVSILILGSRGMLGSELVRQFSANDNYTVIGWDTAECDVTELLSLKQKIHELWPDIIINATAYNAVDLCEKDPKEAKKAELLNTIVPGAVATIAKELDAIFVHYSTDYVFDGQRPRYNKPGRPKGCCGNRCAGCQYMGPDDTLPPYWKYTEDDRPNPLSIYGKTKLVGEELVCKNHGMSYIIRLSKLFGAPAMTANAKKSFFAIMKEKAKSTPQNESIKAVHDEWSHFTYAPDLAATTKSLLEAGENDAPYGIYHLTNTGVATWYDGVMELYKQLGINRTVEPVTSDAFPRPAKRPHSSVLISKKWPALRPWQEALRDFLDIK